MEYLLLYVSSFEAPRNSIHRDCVSDTFNNHLLNILLLYPPSLIDQQTSLISSLKLFCNCHLSVPYLLYSLCTCWCFVSVFYGALPSVLQQLFFPLHLFRIFWLTEFLHNSSLYPVFRRKCEIECNIPQHPYPL